MTIWTCIKSEEGWQRFLALICAGILCLTALAGCSGYAAFTVNGSNVGKGEFESEVERRLSVIRKSNPKELEGTRGEKLEKETERQVATELVRSVLMEQEAKKLGVDVPKEEAGRRLAEERARQGFDKFQKELKEQGLTEAEYLERLEDKVLVEELGKRVCAGVSATKDEAESFYLTHKELFSHTVMVHAAHILLDTEGQANMVADELKRGSDFAALARQVSRDSTTKINGGDLGWIENGTMDPAFEQAAFQLASGQVSGVVKASDGYHIIKVLERREAYTPSFDEVEDEAMKALLSRKKEEKFSDWLRTVYANARVKMPAEVGRWDPRLGMVTEGS